MLLPRLIITVTFVFLAAASSTPAARSRAPQHLHPLHHGHPHYHRHTNGHDQHDGGHRRLGLAGGTSCGSLGSASHLSIAEHGGACGATLARCSARECCDQYGLCRAGDTCGPTCQCQYSGRRSTCLGGGLPTFISTSPTAALGQASQAGLCGDTLARCPDGLCCSPDSFCTDDPAVCSPGNCKPGSSPSHDCAPSLGQLPYAPPTTHDLVFNVTWGVRSMAGITREVILVNGHFPLPTIYATEGDTISVEIHNGLGEPASIHWHGMLQYGNLIMDGVAGVTQRPIPSGGSQRYTFLADLQGTYWWHSHYKAQYIDGLKGSLVVRRRVGAPEDPRLNPPPIMLSDFYPKLSAVLIEEYLNGTSNPEGDEPVPQVALMDGIGQGACSGRSCEYLVVQGVAGGNCSYPQGNIRLALINSAGFATFVVSVAEHLLVVDQLDAVTVGSSAAVSSISIAPGQRVVVFVCPDSTDIDEESEVTKAAASSFFINATMIQSVFFQDSPYATVLGVLSYDPQETGPHLRAEDLPESMSLNMSDDELAETMKGVTQDFYSISTISKETPPAATRNITLEILPFQDPALTSPNLFHFNNISMVFPQRGPSLLEQALAHRLGSNADLGPHVLQVEAGDVVQLVFNNGDEGSHPLHLHGHWMWVMRQGNANEGYYSGQPLVQHPILRDTVEVQANSSLVVRWAANNPGMWLLHCHIDWHLSAGLALVFSYGI